MYLQKGIDIKKKIFFWYLDVHFRKEQDPEPDPHPDPDRPPLVKGTDPGSVPKCHGSGTLLRRIIQTRI
jgi:hypothetical protein